MPLVNQLPAYGKKVFYIVIVKGNLPNHTRFGCKKIEIDVEKRN